MSGRIIDYKTVYHIPAGSYAGAIHTVPCYFWHETELKGDKYIFRCGYIPHHLTQDTTNDQQT